MKKNSKLFIILIGLIAVSVTLALVETDSKAKNIKADLFQVIDSASIKSIAIQGKASQNILERKDANWLLNDKYVTDPNRIKVIKTILSLVTVKRQVARLNNTEIINDLKKNGKSVTVSLNDGSEISFLSGGNSSKSISFFANQDENQAYVVEIPGYSNYISGIFELTEAQWRDRVIFSSSWRTIKSLNINYSNRTDLQIAFKDRFLKVKGISQMDTTALLGYLQQFEYFQVNDYLAKGNYPKYDSLSLTKPDIILSIADIDASKNRQFSVFPIMKGEQFYLLTDQNNQMMVVDKKRMETILVSNKQFVNRVKAD